MTWNKLVHACHWNKVINKSLLHAAEQRLIHTKNQFNNKLLLLEIVVHFLDHCSEISKFWCGY